MRSARADSVNMRPSLERHLHASRGPRRGCAARRRGAPAPRSANQPAIRRKRGHHSARASGRSISDAKCLSPVSRRRASTLCGQGCRKGLREVADCAVNRRAAIRRRQRHVDRIERCKVEDMPRVDRVGVAQPVLDLRDRQKIRPRAARRLRGAGCSIGFGSPWDRSSSSARCRYSLPALTAVFQRSSPATAFSRCRKRDVDRRSATDLRGMRQDDLGNPISWAKSWAARPMRRSGRSRPISRRIGRLSHGSLRASGGQTPSVSPPIITLGSAPGAPRADHRSAAWQRDLQAVAPSVPRRRCRTARHSLRR